ALCWPRAVAGFDLPCVSEEQLGRYRNGGAFGNATAFGNGNATAFGNATLSRRQRDLQLVDHRALRVGHAVIGRPDHRQPDHRALDAIAQRSRRVVALPATALEDDLRHDAGPGNHRTAAPYAESSALTTPAQ